MKIISTLRNKAKNTLYLTVLIAFLASCSKKSDPTPCGGNPPTTTISSGKDISNISILKGENPSITGDGYYFRSGLKIYLTIPLNSVLTNVKINFSLSSKATVKVDGTTLANNSGSFDLTKTITAVVYAENGTSSTYTILAQTGIKEIDAMIYPFMEKYAIPAASYAIGKNSKEDIVYKNAAGFANVALKERAGTDYEFRLASMSKQHTSIAIMSLIQQGKFGLDDLVFGATGILKARWPSVGPKSSKITVRHLLEHTTGFTGDPMFTSASGRDLDDKIDYMLELRASGNDIVAPYAEKYPNSTFVAGRRPWEVKVDIALPCATQNELNGEDACNLIKNSVLCIGEISNMGCTPEAIDAFIENKLMYAPGKAVNAGGVATSGLEMSQNAMHMSWSAQEVDDKLHQIMYGIHEQCVKYGTEPDGYINYVKGANIAGFMKVAHAMMAQGIV